MLTGTPGDNLVRGPVYTYLDSLLTGRWLKLSERPAATCEAVERLAGDGHPPRVVGTGSEGAPGAFGRLRPELLSVLGRQHGFRRSCGKKRSLLRS